MKKAQGLSLNTIVIAAIALIVLVVLVLIFTGNMGSFGIGVKSCEGKSGTCESGADAKTACGDKAYLRGTNCDKDGKYCCISLGE